MGNDPGEKVVQGLSAEFLPAFGATALQDQPTRPGTHALPKS
ncbi:uncharacterized protein METZ01_LOCUS297454, partial [marine metagenome]